MHTMLQDRGEYSLDMFRNDRVAAGDQSPRARGPEQTDCRARRQSGVQSGRAARMRNQGLYVVEQRRRHMNLGDAFLQLAERVTGRDCLQRLHQVATVDAAEQLSV